jgi:hypothetical protein
LRVLHADDTHAYNHYRRHSALGYLTPAAFAAAWNSRMTIASNKVPYNRLQRPERLEFKTGADGEIRTPNLRFTKLPNASSLVRSRATAYSAVRPSSRPAVAGDVPVGVREGVRGGHSGASQSWRLSQRRGSAQPTGGPAAIGHHRSGRRSPRDQTNRGSVCRSR